MKHLFLYLFTWMIAFQANATIDDDTPREVAEYCLDLGMRSNGYKDYGDKWGSGTDWLDVGNQDEWMKNNLAYYATGSEHHVDYLTVICNVNEDRTRVFALAANMMILVHIIPQATGEQAPSEFFTELRKGRSAKVELNGYVVEATKTVWPTGQGWDLTTKIYRASE